MHLRPFAQSLQEVRGETVEIHLVRIRGDAGGDLQYTTIFELEAYGFVGPPAIKGELNGDGHINFADIDPFVLAISDPAAYSAAWPECNVMLADCNGDGLVDAFDIDAFVELLTGG